MLEHDPKMSRAGGRPYYISQQGQTELRKEAAKRESLGNSFTDETFADAVLDMAKSESAAAGGNQHAMQPPSASTIIRLRKAIVPQTMSKPDIQNQRRLEACSDILNFVSLAAVRAAIGDVHPELTINFDKTSILLQEIKPRALVTKGAAKKQKACGQGVTITKDASKSRTVKLLIATSAAGKVIGVVVEIRDRNIKRLTKYPVSHELCCIADEISLTKSPTFGCFLYQLAPKAHMARSHIMPKKKTASMFSS